MLVFLLFRYVFVLDLNRTGSVKKKCSRFLAINLHIRMRVDVNRPCPHFYIFSVIKLGLLKLIPRNC